MSEQANQEAITAWNTVLFDKFLRFREAVTTNFQAHSNAALAHYPPPLGCRALDVGCGFGDTTLALARCIGERGEAVGIDAAARFLDEAERDRAKAGVKNARFLVKDVQSEELGGEYDYVFSRFGVMFFANPVAAFRNLRRALRPSGKIVLVVWRKKEENACFFEPEQEVLSILPHPEKKEDQVTCGPGPFSMASPDLVSAQLKKAGFHRIAFERFDSEICLGPSVDEAIEFAMALGPAGEIVRLAEEQGQKRRPEVVSALQRLLSPKLREGGVYAPSSTWIITAAPT